MSTAVADYPDVVRDLGEKLVGLTVLQANQLANYLENVHGIKAAGGGMMMMPTAATSAAAPVEEKVEQTEFDVILEEFGANKINVIKVVRQATGLGLKEAKDLVEAAPKPIKQALSKEEAAKLKKELEDAGGKVTVK